MKNQYRHHFLLGRTNYMIILLGVAIMVLGYFLMIGGGATNPNEYPVDTLYGVRNTIIAPMLILIGLAVQVVAIFWGNKQAKIDHQEEDLYSHSDQESQLK